MSDHTLSEFTPMLLMLMLMLHVMVSAVDGLTLAKTGIAEAPVTQPVYGDYDNDGVTDVLVLSEHAVWGFTVSVVHHSEGGMVIVIVMLIMMMALVFFGNMDTDGKHTWVKRSTD